MYSNCPIKDDDPRVTRVIMMTEGEISVLKTAMIVYEQHYSLEPHEQVVQNKIERFLCER
jgi:hypothetical protein